MAKLLGTSTKVERGEKIGVLTAVMYLSPASESGRNFCPDSTEGCRLACLGHSSGRLAMPQARAGRIRKSHLFTSDRAAFLAQLRADVAAHERKAKRLGMVAAVRLNGSSDLPWERNDMAAPIMRDFPNVQFYDYTKSYTRALLATDVRTGLASDKWWPANYRLIFSFSGSNHDSCRKILECGGTVAAVFAHPPYPAEWLGFPVIDGDDHDYRYGDPPDHVIALKAKGAAKRDTSGFVIHA